MKKYIVFADVELWGVPVDYEIVETSDVTILDELGQTMLNDLNDSYGVWYEDEEDFEIATGSYWFEEFDPVKHEEFTYE